MMDLEYPSCVNKVVVCWPTFKLEETAFTETLTIFTGKNSTQIVYSPSGNFFMFKPNLET